MYRCDRRCDGWIQRLLSFSFIFTDKYTLVSVSARCPADKMENLIYCAVKFDEHRCGIRMRAAPRLTETRNASTVSVGQARETNVTDRAR